MQRFKSPFSRTSVVATLVFSMVAISLDTVPTHAQPILPSTSAHLYTGETIFKGVLLGDGPVATKLPEIWQSNQLASYKEQRDHEYSAAQIDAQEQMIIQRIKNDDPEFFVRFAKVMQSGNRLQIRAMLRESGERMKALAPKGTDTNTASNWFATDTWLVLWVAVAVAAVAVLVLEIALPAVETADLRGDVLIDLTARRLHVPAPKM